MSGAVHSDERMKGFCRIAAMQIDVTNKPPLVVHVFQVKPLQIGVADFRRAQYLT